VEKNSSPDTVRLIRARAFLGTLKEAAANFMADKAMRLAAALAFYSIFSLGPMLVIAISVAGAVFGDAAAMGAVQRELTASIGASGAEVVEHMLVNARETDSGWMAAIGIGLLFFTASGVFAQLKDALNTVWQIRPKPDYGIKGLVKDRVLAIGMVLSIGLLLFLLVLVSTVLAALHSTVSGWIAIPDPLWRTVNAGVTFAMTMLLFAILFKILPDAHVRLRHVWLGAAITALLFSIGKGLLALYLTRPETASVFGAAGALVVVMLWIYFSAIILLFGAEFTQAHARRRGDVIEPKSYAMTISAALRAREGLQDRSHES